MPWVNEPKGMLVLASGIEAQAPMFRSVIGATHATLAEFTIEKDRKLDNQRVSANQNKSDYILHKQRVSVTQLSLLQSRDQMETAEKPASRKKKAGLIFSARFGATSGQQPVIT